MEVEIIGVITIACGCIAWMAGRNFGVSAFFISTLLSSAAALVLPQLGYANIQPAHLLLGFLALAVIAAPGSLRLAGNGVTFPRAGFWLLLTAIYSTLSAFFLPRIFAGTTYVFAVARTELGPGIISEPLVPVSGNITQSVYFLGDLVCFLVFYVTASTQTGLRATVNAAIACAAVNLCFVAIDLGSYWAGLRDALAVIRNANYRMLDDTVVLGFKRIVGSFPEASTFAYFTSGLFAFCARLSLAEIRPMLTAPIALLSLVTLVFSTSSTGYAATSGFLVLLFVQSLLQMFWRPVTRATLLLTTIAPLLVVTGLLMLRLNEPVWNTIGDMVDATVFEKMNSSSGVERGKWNEQALTNFSDTHGFGAGVGSVRASSFPIAVLGNIGALGALTYGLFLVDILLGRNGRWTDRFPAVCQSAARWACLTQLIGASVAGSFIDLGLPFFIFAGLACARPRPATTLHAGSAMPPTAATAT